ncbi:MAG: M20/M25/M40 family metallo-hydrolase [Acidothermus cellulolyticus]|nr:M20/M25/M40 family metallo-hydrolase [Acidothermus cellulolyticus]
MAQIEVVSVSDEMIETVIERTLDLACLPGASERGCRARARWVMDRLCDLPGRYFSDDVENVVWKLGAVDSESQISRRPALFVHLDTVFDDDVEHAPVRRQEHIVGPGVGDNSLAIAAVITAVSHLYSTGAIRSDLIVVFTVGEEGLGSLRGARYACAAYRPAVALAIEGHGLDVVYARAVGSRRLRLLVQGPGGHSWWDRSKPNAIHGLVDTLVHVRDDVPSSVVVNIGHICGGTAVNALARSAKALVEFRSLDERALRTAEEFVETLSVPETLSVTYEWLDRRPAGELALNHPLLLEIMNVRRALGLPLVISDGSTDANAALEAGIPALALGCARGGQMHTVNEFIEERSIKLGLQQLCGVLQRLPEV